MLQVMFEGLCSVGMVLGVYPAENGLYMPEPLLNSNSPRRVCFNSSSFDCLALSSLIMHCELMFKIFTFPCFAFEQCSVF